MHRTSISPNAIALFLCVFSFRVRFIYFFINFFRLDSNYFLPDDFYSLKCIKISHKTQWICVASCYCCCCMFFFVLFTMRVHTTTRYCSEKVIICWPVQLCCCCCCCYVVCRRSRRRCYLQPSLWCAVVVWYTFFLPISCSFRWR